MGKGASRGYPAGTKRRTSVIVFIIMLGVVSLMADVAAEGVRSVTGPYMVLLGASAAAVGLVSGLAELIGYGLRLVFGWVVDRSGSYWPFMLVGYGINIIAVPALALAGNWEMAMGLILLERVGRALRGPARDAMLSHAGETVGRGWSYGVQEALSSVGGMIGPIIIVMVLLLGGDYGSGFEVLLVPCVLAMLVLAHAMRIEPTPRSIDRQRSLRTEGRSFPRSFWLFMMAGMLIAAGYADFSLISYHTDSMAMVSTSWSPIMYALAMASNALSALVFGRLYDKVGMIPLIVMAGVIPFYVPLVFSANAATVATGMLLYGIGFGAQESVMRAIVADLVPPSRRGTAFGCYNAAFGASWFLGSAALGMLYELSWPVMILLSMGLQFAAIPLLLAVKHGMPRTFQGAGHGARTRSATPNRRDGVMVEDLVFVYYSPESPDKSPGQAGQSTFQSLAPGIISEDRKAPPALDGRLYVQGR